MKTLATLLAQLVLFSPAQLCAQAAASRPQVHGAVTEPDSRQPVTGATITVYLRPEPAPKILINGGFRDVYLTTQTGNDGSFSFEVERYGTIMVRAGKEGYRGAAMFEPVIDQAELTLDAGHPNREVELHLTRPGAISGSVVDEETRKPVAHVKLAAMQADYQGGRRRFLPAGSAAETDEAGRFLLTGLTPAEFVVVVRPQSQEEGRVVTNFEPGEFDAVDRDFERSWWPGGHDPELAVPVPVLSGHTFDLGQIAVRKAPLYRVMATLSAAGCRPGDTVQVNRAARSGFLSAMGNSSPVACGQPFLMTGLTPGTYWLEARRDRGDGSGVERASVQVEIRDKNVEVKGTLARGVDIDVRIVPDEGARQVDWSGVRMLLRPIGRAPFLGDLPGPLDEGGRLRLLNVEARDYLLEFAGLPDGFYVKELRYNGARQPFGSLTVSGAAMAHKLEVLVGDQPASVAGETQPGARVVLARWPVTTMDPRMSLRTADAGEDGKYQFTGLAPGEYRIFAVQAASARKLERPGVLDSVLQAAKKVTLAPNGAHREALDVVRP